MGCTHDRIDNSNYEDPFYPEERDIRKWEISLGFFNKTFFEVVSEFNSKIFLEDEEITNKKFESFLNKVFGDKNLMNVFDNDFFRNNKNKINCKYVKLLFLLLCAPDKVPNADSSLFNNLNLDKVEFLLIYINDGFSEDLKRSDVELLLDPLFHISCIKLPECYKISKGQNLSDKEGYLSELKNHTEKIKKIFFDELFGQKEDINIQDLNEIVKDNTYVKKFIF